MSEIINVKSLEEFNKEINCDIPVLVDFWATWCYPCSMQAPIVHDFNEKTNGKVKVIKVDVDEGEEIAVKYNISSIPTLMLFVGGKEIEKTVGLSQEDEISEMVNKYLK